MSDVLATLLLMLLGAAAFVASDIARACERRDESDALDQMDAMG